MGGRSEKGEAQGPPSCINGGNTCSQLNSVGASVCCLLVCHHTVARLEMISLEIYISGLANEDRDEGRVA
jgi:hypothetical protein